MWRMEEKVPAELQRPLWGIEFGCRTSVIYVPPKAGRPSLSCLWELARSGRQKRFAPTVQQQIEAGLAIGVNVLAYATNRQLRAKEETFQRPDVPALDGSDRGRIYVASLRHPGGCTAAPRALPNLLAAAARELKLRIGGEERQLNITDPSLFNYHLAFMHGRSGFELTPEERKQLKTYLERGGMILADSICASPAFTESFHREMALILPGKRLAPVPPNDRMLSRAYGGFDLSSVTQRVPQPEGSGGLLKDVVEQGPPVLEAIKLDDRYAVVFSPYDLSCALEKQNSVECRGYSRDDAARIGMNVILYSLQ